MTEDTSTVIIKKEPEVLQEEQEDLIFSYLNADYMSTDSAPINDPPSPPYSTSSGSTDTAPLNNTDIDMIMDSPPLQQQHTLCGVEDPFFLQLQSALSEQGLTMPWPSAAAAALATTSTIPFPGVQDPSCLMNIHPLIIPSPATNTTNQNSLLSQQPPPPLYHHPSFLPINNNNNNSNNNNNNNNLRSSSFSSSSSTTSSNSDNEQSKKKRNGRKKREVSIAPAPLKNLAPILPAATATVAANNNPSSSSIQPQTENLHHVGNVEPSSVITSLDKIPSSESNSNNINNTTNNTNQNNNNNNNTINNTSIINSSNNNNPNHSQPPTPEKSPAEIAYAKRQERLIKNRAAALLSRKRKREHLTSLEDERQKLLNENDELKTKVNTLEEKITTLEKENLELKKKLSSSSSSTSSTSSTSSSSLTSSLSPISFLTSQKYNHHHLATPKHAKTTGMVFMIILFSFALFTLPSSRTSQLTVGGSPKPNIPLIGSSTSRIPDIKLESIEKSETLTTTTASSTTTIDNDNGKINNNNNTTSTVPSDLILINRVQPKDLHSWVKNKLTQNQNQNSGTELIQWSGSGDNKISETISATSSASSSNHLYLYAKEFSQLGFSNNKEHKSILSLSSPSSSSSATIGSTLSIICPLNTTSHCETSYLQIDVLVIGSRVLQGELKHQYKNEHEHHDDFKMDNINDNQVLLNNMKDDIIQSLLVKSSSSSPFNDSHYPLDSTTKKTILNRRKIRRKKLQEEKRKRISRVVLE